MIAFNMKKFFGILVLLFLIFIILIYASLNTTPKKIENSILINIDTIDIIDFITYDSVYVEATTQYKSNQLKRIMQGEHYRKAWSTPIKVPIVFLDTLFGGVTIVKEGGGNQTKSLKLLANNNSYYTLRSINKTPEALVPEFAKTLGLKNIVVDGISAQHPYGALVVARLAEKAGILHSFPKLVFLPKQSALGSYSDKYGNRLFFLEYETESKNNWTKYSNVIEIIDTKDLQELKMAHGANLQIDRHALVRARLFDLIIGDWDRHPKQWGWVIQKENDTYKAIPLPVDRDNAFFNSEGVIPNLVLNRNVTPEAQAFDEDIDYLPGLVQSFDVYFLQDIPESVFVEEAKSLQKLLTDEKIDNAFKAWPDAIYDLDGEEISKKIKSRRNDLVDYAIRFKTILDKKPLLTEPLKGSEALELPNNLLACFGCNKTVK